MKKLFLLIALISFHFTLNSQDDNKKPEKKLASASSAKNEGLNKPERKMVEPNTLLNKKNKSEKNQKPQKKQSDDNNKN